MVPKIVLFPKFAVQNKLHESTEWLNMCTWTIKKYILFLKF